VILEEGDQRWSPFLFSQPHEVKMDESNKPFPKFLRTFDERGRESRRDYLEDEDKPGLCFFGYSTSVHEYDDQGRETKVMYFGLDGQPCTRIDGFSLMTSEYDEKGNVQKTAYRIASDSMNKVWLAEYDCLGRNTKLTFFDLEGRPCSDSRKSFGKRV
jgi:hypothetical protein